MNLYQTGYSDINPTLFNEPLRLIKAKKILKIINDFSKQDLKSCNCLEIGCSTGVNTNLLAVYCSACLGIDIDENALQYARRNSGCNTQFIIADGMRLPLPDNSFDIIICNHVYEHVPDSRLLIEEIFRILKPGGFCYFAAGNKYALMEGHYHLPFLSWLPRSLSNYYLKIMRRGEMYYENHLSYFQLKHLTRRFVITDYTIKVIREPERFGAEDMIRPNSFTAKIPVFLLKGLLPFIPTYIFLMTKSPDSKDVTD